MGAPPGPPSGSDPSPGGQGLAQRRLRVRRAERVWLRSILEAYEGLACWFAEPAGETFLLLTPSGRVAELDAVLASLAAERPGAFLTLPSGAP